MATKNPTFPEFQIQESLCECGCEQTPSPGKRFVRHHQVKLMQQRNKEREYSREHLEKLWAATRGKPGWRRRPRVIITCACGCGNTLITPDDNGRPRQYIKWHQTKSLVGKRERPYPPSPTKGRKASPETLRKLREAHLGKFRGQPVIPKEKVSKPLGRPRIKPRLPSDPQPCACGCGVMIIPVDSENRPRRYIYAHRFRDPRTREALSKARTGKPSPKKGKPTGKPSWNKGKKGLFTHTPEARRRIGLAQTGDRNWNWKGGTDTMPRIHSSEWHALRRRIYERDRWRCGVCDTHCHGNINCHHIIPVRHGGPDDEWNLITVCRSCHAKQEPLYGSTRYHWGYFPIQDYGIVTMLTKM